MERRVNDKINIYQTMYRLPSLEGRLQPGMSTMLNPGENYSIRTSETPAAPTQRAMFKGREIVVRDNKWVYADDGKEAK
jgi:hypothetical protein